jgi:hypothetical protein
MFERAKDVDLAKRRARTLLAKVDKWHRWFYEMRDPHSEGLVAILHPWESGRDNSIDWDEAFERVPTEGVDPYVRRDTQHADPAHRPTKAQYDRYLWLVQHFRALGWDNAKLHDASPFQVVDPGFNAILIRSCSDLAELADTLDEAGIAADNRARAAQGLAAMESLWSPRHGQYLCKDRTTGKLIDSASIGGILPVFADVPKERAQDVARTIESWAGKAKYLVPSHDPADPRFEAKRYWRGPAWLVMNYMIADGLRREAETAVADHIVRSSLELITQSGFAEYYDPKTGEPCGGGRFTWTAAMVVEFLEQAS